MSEYPRQFTMIDTDEYVRLTNSIKPVPSSEFLRVSLIYFKKVADVIERNIPFGQNKDYAQMLVKQLRSIGETTVREF